MLGCSSSVTKKRDQAKNKALQIYFRKLCRYLNTRNFNIDLFSVWDSVHYPTQILLTVPPEFVRAYVNVITKFSGIDRFPFHAWIIISLSTVSAIGTHFIQYLSFFSTSFPEIMFWPFTDVCKFQMIWDQKIWYLPGGFSLLEKKILCLLTTIVLIYRFPFTCEST